MKAFIHRALQASAVFFALIGVLASALELRDASASGPPADLHAKPGAAAPAVAPQPDSTQGTQLVTAPRSGAGVEPGPPSPSHAGVAATVSVGSDTDAGAPTAATLAPDRPAACATSQECNDAGMRSYRLKDYVTAAREFAVAVEMQSSNEKAIYNLACCHALLGNSAAAVKLLEALAELDTNEARARIRKSATDPDFDGIRSDPEFMAFHRAHANAAVPAAPVE